MSNTMVDLSGFWPSGVLTLKDSPILHKAFVRINLGGSEV
jgi:hypothetical protein